METTIKVEKLCKSYAHVKAVENVNISIRRGEVFGLLGANGAGKSTTMECILGTKKQDSGRVSILGMNPQKDRKKLLARVGVQFQEANYQDKIKVAELCEVTASLYKTSLDEVEALCDKIMILKNGGSVFCGTVQEAVEASPYEKLEDAYLWYTDEEVENESIQSFA